MRSTHSSRRARWRDDRKVRRPGFLSFGRHRRILQRLVSRVENELSALSPGNEGARAQHHGTPTLFIGALADEGDCFGAAQGKDSLVVRFFSLHSPGFHVGSPQKISRPNAGAQRSGSFRRCYVVSFRTDCKRGSRLSAALGPSGASLSRVAHCAVFVLARRSTPR
jgi:hypothetical protein